jgi:hypothetical protein
VRGPVVADINRAFTSLWGDMVEELPDDEVDEALLGSLGEVRTALEDVLDRSDRAVAEATQTALGEEQGDDTTATP